LSRRRVFLLVLALLAACSPVAARSQGIIANLQLDKFAFSPNDDGVTDSTVITYTLSDTATVHLLILGMDSVTVIDTLVGGIQQNPQATPASVTWKGTFSGGGVVPEDRYLVFLRARSATASDSTYLTLSVDLTPPQVMIVGVSPSTPFAPNVPGQPSPLKVDYVVTDPPPSDSVFVTVTLLDPAAAIIQTLVTTDQPVGSTLRAQWDGSGATTDGSYEVRIAVTDAAGQTANTSTTIDVDMNIPDLTITNLQANQDLPAIPDSLFGWAWDRSGIDSLFVRYSGGVEAFEQVTSTRLVLDTLFFAVQLVDSLTADGTYTLGFKATDRVSRERVVPFAITLDSAAPPAPVLVQPPSPTRSPTFLLDTAVNVSADTDVMRIFRNGTLLDSIFPNLPAGGNLPYEVPLLPGTNRFSAIAVDRADNVSPLSNEIVVVFDSAAGMSMPQPFVANNSFQINLSKPALVVTLKIYDLGGHLVEELSSGIVSTSVTISWDGLNGDHDLVEKGPLVAVAKVDYQDGGREIFREIFLFQP
jgi:flagellar hook assembly protein FlgD